MGEIYLWLDYSIITSDVDKIFAVEFILANFKFLNISI